MAGKKVIIAAGGTGGHIFPGVAIAQEMKELDPDLDITFAGTERGLEARILNSLGWNLIFVKSSPLKGKGLFGKLIALIKVPFSVMRAMGIVKRERPDLLISIGGYAAGPLAIASWLKRVPVVLVEPNAIPGMTNRILGRFARVIFTAFDEASKYFDDRKVVLSGTPIRRELMKALRTEAKKEGPFTVFVFGGSQGAARLNDAMADAAMRLKDMKDRIHILHQTGGHSDAGSIEQAYADASLNASTFDFTDRIWECYEKADMVIARAGAGTVAELMALAIPSILVPYPYAADDHQRANANSLVSINGAIMVLDKDCTGEKLAEIIRSMIARPEEVERMRRALANKEFGNASRRIAKMSLELM